MPLLQHKTTNHKEVELDCFSERPTTINHTKWTWSSKGIHSCTCTHCREPVPALERIYIKIDAVVVWDYKPSTRVSASSMGFRWWIKDEATRGKRKGKRNISIRCSTSPLRIRLLVSRQTGNNLSATHWEWFTPVTHSITIHFLFVRLSQW